LNFNEKQFAQIEDALAVVKTGTLKLKCPHCKMPMELLADGSLADWRSQPKGIATGRNVVEPPQPPDINWLTTSEFEDSDAIKDIPKVLILMDPGPARDSVLSAMVESFFQPVTADTEGEAVEQMQAVQFDSIILHSRFDGEPFKQGRVHDILKRMNMSRRRYIFYVLLGPEFNTLYSLEALTYSANLVVNEKDVEHMKNIYKKGKSESDELFLPYINTLKEHGVGNS
jgi:CheY-like chemotaxis protein